MKSLLDKSFVYTSAVSTDISKTFARIRAKEKRMETKEYRTVGKADWIRGEWDDEPDKKQWQDESTGLPCLIVRGTSGALCGYVGVPEGHPAFEKGYDDVSQADGEYISVHGGLTFANRCADTADESKHICHKPAPGESDNVWWLGFDCAHSGDLCPSYAGRYGSTISGESYKAMRYVESQVRKLAEQLKALSAT